MHKTFNQIEKTNKMVSETERSSCASTAKEVKAGINEIQKDFHSRIEMIKSCVQATDNSVNTLKTDLGQKSKTCATNLDQLQSSNREIQESKK